MSMITLNGTLLHVYKQPTRKEGEAIEKDKIQVLGDIPQENGELRKDLVTITVPDAAKWRDLVGSEVQVPVGAFSPNKGTVIFFATKA